MSGEFLLDKLLTSFNMKKLDKIAALQDNWNGYGAEPLSPQVIERTRRLIQGLVI